MELTVIYSYQEYYSRAKVNIFSNTSKIFGIFFYRSETVVTPMFLPCKSHFYHKILHRLSIDTPSFRWTNDGDAMEYLRRNSR